MSALLGAWKSSSHPLFLAPRVRWHNRAAVQRGEGMNVGVQLKFRRAVRRVLGHANVNLLISADQDRGEIADTLCDTVSNPHSRREASLVRSKTLSYGEDYGLSTKLWSNGGAWRGS